VSSFRLRARYPGFALDAEASWEEPCTALFGASGSGKSTVLESLAGLRREVSGEIVLAGRRVDALPPHRRGTGWVPQDAALFPHLCVRGNLEFAARRVHEQRALKDAIAALEIDGLLERRADELSGGERQRVAIARALASRPRVLLLDEPLASIDRPLRARLLPFLERLPERTGVPVFLVTHDPLEVLALAQEVLVIESGRIVQQGAPRSVFASAATFGALPTLGAENRFEVRVVARAAGTLEVETRGGSRLSMVRVEGFPDPEAVAVRGEDVMLAERDPGRVSAQNVFAADVLAVEPLGEQLLVDFAPVGAADERWRVKITPRARAVLSVEPGRRLVLLVKAHAILPCGRD